MTLSPEVNQNRIHQPGWTLRVLMLSWEYPPHVVGGLSRHVHGLSVQLASMGHEVHVLTAGNENSPPYEHLNDVHVHRVIPLNHSDESFLSWVGGLNLALTYQAERLSEEVAFDLIHAHDWLVGTAAIVLKESLGIPLLTTIHATEHGRNNGIYTELQKFIHQKEVQLTEESDQLIVCSQYMREMLSEIFQAPDGKMAVIANGIEVPEQTEWFLEEVYPDAAGKRYIFSIGRMVKEKGFDTIIQAADIARKNERDYFFLIAGTGPLLETYRQEVSARNLEEYIQFIGYISDHQRNALIHGCEMAVFPSIYEPFGIVALESMVMGKPTIVSKTGGLKGIVQHLKTGLYMLPNNAHHLLEQIELLKTHPETAKELGQNGMLAASSMYGWKRIAEETCRIMRDTVIKQRIDEK